MENYCLLTDATAELTAEMEKELDVEIIPMPVDIDSKPYSFKYFDEKISDTQFYEMLSAGKFPHTSQINEAVYMDCFEKYLKNGTDVLYLCFTSGLSSTYAAACRCAEQLRVRYPERKIAVLDTLCASAGVGLLVYTAAKKRLAGKTLSEVYTWAKQNAHSVCHCFTADDLEHLRRGGRISSAAAVFGSALQIKPVLVVDNDGKLQTIAKARGTKRARLYQLSALKNLLLDTEESSTLFLAQSACPEEAKKMADAIKAEIPHVKNIITVPIGPIVGTHLGSGALEVIFYGKDRMCKI